MFGCCSLVEASCLKSQTSSPVQFKLRKVNNSNQQELKLRVFFSFLEINNLKQRFIWLKQSALLLLLIAIIMKEEEKDVMKEKSFQYKRNFSLVFWNTCSAIAAPFPSAFFISRLDFW